MYACRVHTTSCSTLATSCTQIYPRSALDLKIITNPYIVLPHLPSCYPTIRLRTTPPASYQLPWHPPMRTACTTCNPLPSTPSCTHLQYQSCTAHQAQTLAAFQLHVSPSLTKDSKSALYQHLPGPIKLRPVAHGGGTSKLNGTTFLMFSLRCMC